MFTVSCGIRQKFTESRCWKLGTLTSQKFNTDGVLRKVRMVPRIYDYGTFVLASMVVGLMIGHIVRSGGVGQSMSHEWCRFPCKTGPKGRERHGLQDIIIMDNGECEMNYTYAILSLIANITCCYETRV